MVQCQPQLVKTIFKLSSFINWISFKLSLTELLNKQQFQLLNTPNRSWHFNVYQDKYKKSLVTFTSDDGTTTELK